MPRERGQRGARETAPSLADAALGLAREGWAVFPCGPDKAPLVEGGFHAASAEPSKVEAMPWGRAALIGAAIPDGQVVVDVDPRNGGDDTMQAFKEAGLKLPRTRVVQTGGGGFHYHFCVPKEVTLRGRLGPGVDVKRAGRGYIIVPPSPGYRLQRGDKAAALPDWLLDALLAPEREHVEGEAAAPRFMPWEPGTPYGTAALERTLGRLASAAAGSRNDELNKAAFAVAQLVAGGELAGEASRAALEEVAARLNLTQREIKNTIESGWRAGTDDPRQAPPREASGEEKSAAGAGVGVDKEAHSLRRQNPSPVDEDRFWLNWEVDEPPPAYLLDPILPENAYVLVYGPAEASKSMVFTALGAEASRRGVKTTLYSLENPPHVERDRLRRLRPDSEFFRATNEPLDLNDPRQFQAFVEREAEWEARLIIIDTYSHAFASRSDDGNARAIEFARRVRFLMHETGATVVVVDHVGYSQDGEPRDASAKRQQVDVAVLMSKVGVWERGRPARFSAENRKTARFGNPFSLTGSIRDGEDRRLELVWDGRGPTWA